MIWVPYSMQKERIHELRLTASIFKSRYGSLKAVVWNKFRLLETLEWIFHNLAGFVCIYRADNRKCRRVCPLPSIITLQQVYSSYYDKYVATSSLYALLYRTWWHRITTWMMIVCACTDWALSDFNSAYDGRDAIGAVLQFIRSSKAYLINSDANFLAICTSGFISFVHRSIFYSESLGHIMYYLPIPSLEISRRRQYEPFPESDVWPWILQASTSCYHPLDITSSLESCYNNVWHLNQQTVYSESIQRPGSLDWSLSFSSSCSNEWLIPSERISLFQFRPSTPLTFRHIVRCS